MTKPQSADRRYDRKEVVQIIQSVMTGVGSETEATKKLQQELQLLHDYIENMRSELAQMRSIEISHKHIPTVTDELDAVVGETATATGKIMDACDRFVPLAEKLEPGIRDEITAIVTSIYEACSFQDITGQRITKVVKTVKNIETKVGDILSAFGHAMPGADSADARAAAAPTLQEQASLLNGPQLKGPGVSQAEIDRLLADFDTK